jgi:hypothetical protein
MPGEDGVARANGIPRLFYVDEIAQAWGVDKLFIQRKLRKQEWAGVKVGRRWAMTEAQMQAALESMSTTVRVPEHLDRTLNPAGLTPTSLRRRNRGQW